MSCCIMFNLSRKSFQQLHRFWHPGRFAMQMPYTSSSNLENLESIRESLCQKCQCTKLRHEPARTLKQAFLTEQNIRLCNAQLFCFPSLLYFVIQMTVRKRSEKGNEVPPLRLGMHYSVFGLVTWVFVLEYPRCCAGQGINSYTAHRVFSHSQLQSKPKGNLMLIAPGSLARSWR